MRNVLIILILMLVNCAAFADVEAAKTRETSLLDKLSYPIETKKSQVFVGVGGNPHYKVDCKNTSGHYDPYYCGLRGFPEIKKFNTPHAGVTFSF